MVYETPQLTLWEKTTLVAALFRVLGNGFYTSLVAPFRGSSGSAKYLNHVKLAMVRTLVSDLSVRQMQSLGPSMDEMYPAYAKKQGFKPESITLSDGTKAHWVGNKDAEKVVIWFHGGGYALPPDPQHLTFASEIVDATGPRVSVLMLAYTLSPHGTYPVQLRQAVALLRHLVTNLGRQPENVTIAGDSAGANLTLGTLSHLLHPHPEIEPLELGGKLGAAILLSPWVSFSMDWPSNIQNGKKDLVTSTAGNRWSASFLGGKKSDQYSEPCKAEEGWWKGMDDVVREILVLGGSDELLLDQIRVLVRRLKPAHPNITVVIAEGEWHDRPCNGILGGGGEMADAIKSFVKSRL